MAVWRFLRDIAPTIFESPENPYINHLMSNAKKKVFNPGTNILEEGLFIIITMHDLEETSH